MRAVLMLDQRHARTSCAVVAVASCIIRIELQGPRAPTPPAPLASVRKCVSSWSCNDKFVRGGLLCGALVAGPGDVLFTYLGAAHFSNHAGFPATFTSHVRLRWHLPIFGTAFDWPRPTTLRALTSHHGCACAEPADTRQLHGSAIPGLLRRCLASWATGMASARRLCGKPCRNVRKLVPLLPKIPHFRL